jgi:hypothetical protein
MGPQTNGVEGCREVSLPNLTKVCQVVVAAWCLLSGKGTEAASITVDSSARPTCGTARPSLGWLRANRGQVPDPSVWGRVAVPSRRGRSRGVRQSAGRAAKSPTANEK